MTLYKIVFMEGDAQYLYLSTINHIEDFSKVLSSIGFRLRSISIVHTGLFTVEPGDTLDSLRAKKREVEVDNHKA